MGPAEESLEQQGGEEQGIKQKSFLPSRLRAWFPPPGKISFSSPEVEVKNRDEVSLTIRRVMLAMVVYAIFVLVTLGSPDEDLLKNQIKVPFADVPVGFFDFLVLGPLIMIGLTAYLHIYLDYRHTLKVANEHDQLPFIFNMTGRFPRFISILIFYLLGPAVLFIFLQKATPLAQDNPLIILYLFCLFFFNSIILLGLGIRRIPMEKRRGWGFGSLWVLFLFMFYWGGDTGVQFFNVVRAGPSSASLASKAEAPKAQADKPKEKEKKAADKKGRKPASSTDVAKAEPKAGSGPSEEKTGGKAAEKEKTAKAPVQQVQQQQVFKPLRFVSRSLSLPGADLTKVDLKNRPLVGANLRGAILEGKDLNGLDFSKADLAGADLRNTNFVNANLSGANLKGANLEDSNLNGAKLISADLTNAYLRGAKLRGANVKDVIWKNAVIWDIDFAGMQNIDCKKIRGTSSNSTSQNTLKELTSVLC